VCEAGVGVRVAGIAAGIAAGFLGGVLAGLKAGEWARGSAARYWSLNAAALLGSLALDLVGIYTHRTWLASGSLGLMAGLLTGLKYGYSPPLRLRESPPADRSGAAAVDEVPDEVPADGDSEPLASHEAG
jgi:hypothetical protein